MLKDRRGTAAWELVLVFLPFFLMLFSIFDIGRYAITQYSLQTLASVGARSLMIVCYNDKVVINTSPSTCTGADPYPFKDDAAKQAVAPFLYFGGLTPKVRVDSGANLLTVTATQPGFAWIMPIWGTLLTAPAASTTVPY